MPSSAILLDRRPASLFARMGEHGLAEHAVAVATLTGAVCAELALEPSEGWRVQRAALLHDVGKLEIPTDLLHHPGPLGARAWERIRRHPIAGERLVSGVPWLADLGELVRHHHERWDGDGYPDGLAGGAIPLGARVIAACDALATMVAGRPYQPALGSATAMELLACTAGRQLDPVVVDALSSVVAAAPSMLP